MGLCLTECFCLAKETVNTYSFYITFDKNILTKLFYILKWLGGTFNS